MTTTTVVLVCLAVYRGTLLVTSDRVTRTPRRWLREQLRRRSHRPTVAFESDTGWPTAIVCPCGWSVASIAASGPPPWPVYERQSGVAAPKVVDPGAPTIEITQVAMRDARVRHEREAPDTSRLGFLLECPWCISLWLGIIAAAVAWAWPDGWWRWPALALAASAVAGLLATIASPDDNDPED